MLVKTDRLFAALILTNDHNPQPMMCRVSKLEERQRRISSSLEDHLEVWRRDPEFLAKYRLVVDYIRTTLRLDMTEDTILRVITSSYTNDFSHTLPNGNQVSENNFKQFSHYCMHSIF